jgi:hypothetical protein
MRTRPVGADLRAARRERQFLPFVRFSWEGRPLCRPTNYFWPQKQGEKWDGTEAHSSRGHSTRFALQSGDHGIRDFAGRGFSAEVRTVIDLVRGHGFDGLHKPRGGFLLSQMLKHQ